jgi:hypothetical protein
VIKISEDAMRLCSDTVQRFAGAQTNSKCLRLISRGDRVAISFETPRNDDHIVYRDGQSIVAVPEDVADTLSGKTLDLSDDGALVIA